MKIIFFILLITLSGCAHRIAAPVIDNPRHYQQQLSQLTHWSLQGKIAIRHTKRSDSAALQWQQENDRFDIFVSGPLGAGATRLSGTPQQLSIHNGSEQTTTTDDPTHLMEQHLGWELPLQKLPQWITGRSDHPDATFNPDHTLAVFTERNWQVRYVRYQTVGPWLLPEKILLQHETMQVTIFIKHWELP